MATTIVLATRNVDKVREIRDIFPSPFTLVSLSKFPESEDVVEDGDTLLANAEKKARAAFLQTDLPAMADDTGLEVDALHGAPGVRSARFAGEKASYRENCEKLLRLMDNVPWEKRTARFRTVVSFVSKDNVLWTEGVCEGVIHTDFHGEQGFGYDPLFYVPEKEKTFAQMTALEKNAISHRGMAFRKMGERLAARFIL